jgi:hypothetical protein
MPKKIRIRVHVMMRWHKEFFFKLSSVSSPFGGLVDSLLAIRPKIRGGSNPAEGAKICSTPSSGWEVKPSAPYRKTLKNPSKYEQRYFVRKNSFPSPIPPALLLDDSVGRIARELWWANYEFFPVDIISL